jgi:hypothetical protein
MLKIYIHGYLNRVRPSRRMKRKVQRNLELIWLTGSLAPPPEIIAIHFSRTDTSARAAKAEFTSFTGTRRNLRSRPSVSGRLHPPHLFLLALSSGFDAESKSRNEGQPNLRISKSDFRMVTAVSMRSR